MITSLLHWFAHQRWRQNLMKDDKSHDRYFYNKRGRVMLFGNRQEMSWEIHVDRRPNWMWRWTLEVQRGGEYYTDFDARLITPFFGIYLGFDKMLPAWLGCPKNNKYNFDEGHGRQYGINWYCEYLRFQWGVTPMSSGRRGHWGPFGWNRWESNSGRELCIDVSRLFLGRQEYKEGGGGKESFDNVPIRMPEGTYHIKGTISTDVWWRSRWPWWPFRHELSRGHCEVVEKTGIPVPGKGENSYDCGDDSTHGVTCPAKSVDELVKKVIDGANEKRTRYGGGPNMYLKRMMAGEAVRQP